METQINISAYASSHLPTKFGEFLVTVFKDEASGKEHLAIQKGEVTGENVLLRVHSECLTSEVLGSLKCDCNDQLETAMHTIARNGKGLIIYLRQEGRGIGLGNKIRAYALQEEGYDTVEANHILGFKDDLRNYTVAGAILNALSVKSVQLMTNNPRKISGLEASGIKVKRRVPIQIQPNAHNFGYLKTKAEKSGHLLNFGENLGFQNQNKILFEIEHEA